MNHQITAPLRWAKGITKYPYMYGFTRAMLRNLLDDIEAGRIPNAAELTRIRETLQRVDIGDHVVYDGFQGAKTNNVATTDPVGEPKNSNL